jgi:glycogen debranching enzyme
MRHDKRERWMLSVPNPWMFKGESTVGDRTGASVTLVEGSTFSIASPTGDIDPGGAEGLFFEDTRFLSTWRLRLDQQRPQCLAVLPSHPFAATFVSRGQPRSGEADSDLLLLRSRYVGNGMREDIAVQNLGREPAVCTIGFELDADFAHLFEVKENHVRDHGQRVIDVSDSLMSFVYWEGEVNRALEVAFPDGAQLTPGNARLEVVVPPAGEWRSSIEFRLCVDGEAIELSYCGDEPEADSAPVAQLQAWEQTATRVRADDRGLNATFVRSERDLGALRIVDPDHPDRSVIAAGAPWFMTLFGRDSLITSMMAMGLHSNLAMGTLLTLARMQGERIDPLTEEEPGKILHELRRGLATIAGSHTGSIYYGSIDATPLFVVTLGVLHRWGAPAAVVAELLPHADRALAWIEEFGDRDGDGFVEYQRTTARGLVNQGWKDSFDGVSFADGTLAEAPIALSEVQGYVYAAYVARAEIADALGDDSTAQDYASRAAHLKKAFNERFWLEAKGYYAMGLDGEKRPIDSLTSNMGHCLWSGIVDEDKARRTVDQLCGSEMFTGWGIRTLASSMSRYNPVSYHNGSVWPHDSAICAAGLTRYGFLEEAQAVALGIFRAAEVFGGRLPELFCGFDSDQFPIPIPYPAACAPQAWASASPFWLLQTTLLRLEASIPNGLVSCAARIPEKLGRISVENLLLSDARLSIEALGNSATVSGLPDGLRLVESLASPPKSRSPLGQSLAST